MNKKFVKIMTAVILCMSMVMISVCVANADAAIGDYYDYDVTDVSYDVTVSASDGYVNVRTGPGTDYDILVQVVNGEVMHASSEATAANGKTWACVEYDGYYGWISLTQVTKGSSASKSSGSSDNSNKSSSTDSTPKLITQLYQGGTDADYAVEVNSSYGGVELRYGPGSSYDVIIGSIPNATVLDITKTDADSDGVSWGYTLYNGSYGWVNLSQSTVCESDPEEADTSQDSDDLTQISGEDAETFASYIVIGLLVIIIVILSVILIVVLNRRKK